MECLKYSPESFQSLTIEVIKWFFSFSTFVILDIYPKLEPTSCLSFSHSTSQIQVTETPLGRLLFRGQLCSVRRSWSGAGSVEKPSSERLRCCFRWTDGGRLRLLIIADVGVWQDPPEPSRKPGQEKTGVLCRGCSPHPNFVHSSLRRSHVPAVIC